MPIWVDRGTQKTPKLPHWISPCLGLTLLAQLRDAQNDLAADVPRLTELVRLRSVRQREDIANDGLQRTFVDQARHFGEARCVRLDDVRGGPDAACGRFGWRRGQAYRCCQHTARLEHAERALLGIAADEIQDGVAVSHDV